MESRERLFRASFWLFAKIQRETYHITKVFQSITFLIDIILGITEEVRGSPEQHEKCEHVRYIKVHVQDEKMRSFESYVC